MSASGFDIDPQEVIMRVEQILERGWVRGTYHRTSSSTSAPNPLSGEHASGFCIRGAFTEALSEVFFEQLRLRIPAPVYGEGVSQQTFESFLQQKAKHFALTLEWTFAEHMEQTVLRGTTVVGWNDASVRRKSEVLETIRSFLTVVLEESFEDAARTTACAQAEADVSVEVPVAVWVRR